MIKDCDYIKYYNLQSGGNLDDKILVYKGRQFQRGNGIFSKLRYSIPYFKKFGKEVLDLGRNILFDYASGQNLKSATQKNLKRKASDLLKKAVAKVEQYGTGRKKRRYKKGKTDKTKIIKRRKFIKSKSYSPKRRKLKQRLKSDIFK